MSASRAHCSACGVQGHNVTMCRDPAALGYWRAAAQRHRAASQEHAVRSRQAAEAGAEDDARYHRRATLLESHDADRAERRAKAIERRAVVAR
jgi:hypothetical protein